MRSAQLASLRQAVPAGELDFVVPPARLRHGLLPGAGLALDALGDRHPLGPAHAHSAIIRRLAASEDDPLLARAGDLVGVEHRSITPHDTPLRERVEAGACIGPVTQDGCHGSGVTRGSANQFRKVAVCVDHPCWYRRARVVDLVSVVVLTHTRMVALGADT